MAGGEPRLGTRFDVHGSACSTSPQPLVSKSDLITWVQIARQKNSVEPAENHGRSRLTSKNFGLEKFSTAVSAWLYQPQCFCHSRRQQLPGLSKLGNTADVTLLLPVVKRLRERFGIRQACIVADRGMISADTIAD
jgi:hypothetical protein